MDTREERVLAGQNNDLSRLRYISHFELFCGWWATQEKENFSWSTEDLLCWIIACLWDKWRWLLNVSCFWLTQAGGSVYVLFSNSPRLWFTTSIDICSTGTLLSEHVLSKSFTAVKSFRVIYTVALQSKCSSLNLTEWISGVSDLEVTLHLTYSLMVGAPKCFTVYSHLAKGVKTDSKHPVMKLISWETL